MRNEILKRSWLNAAMAVLLPVTMNCRYMGNELHEIAGMLLSGLFILHNLWNRRWCKYAKKISPDAKLRAV